MYYIALLVPSSVGEWRVVFPDLPECQAHGYPVDDATLAATTALSRCLAENRHFPPLPRATRNGCLETTSICTR